ncbi:MAG: T9SS type A sorting domain-containing protein [Saprospiraceae bacterium]|nr:T9SS type A sorting domain-containing protein [Saprospiraceae bacterium]
MTRIILLTLLGLLLLINTSAAQGWQKRYGNPNQPESGRRITRTPDGGYLLHEWFFPNSGIPTFYSSSLLRLDAEGDMLWRRDFENQPVFNWPADGPTLIDPNGDIFLTFQDSIHKLDPGGNTIFRLPSDRYIMLGQQTDGIILYKARWYIDSLDLRKYDFDGNLIWQKNYTLPGDFVRIAMAPDGRIVVVNQSNNNIRVYSPNGNLLYFTDTPVGYSNITFDNVGNYIFYSGYLNFVQGSEHNFFRMAKLSPDGDSLWTHEYLTDIADIGERLIPTADGGYLIVGRSYYDPYRKPRLYRLDADGNELWTRTINPLHATYFEDGALNPDGTFVLSGRRNDAPETDNGSCDAIVWKFNADGTQYSNVLVGKIVNDLNLNCMAGNNEPGMQNWKVEMNELLVVSDTNGYFEFQLDSGTYDITLHHNGQYWDPCPGYDDYTFNGNYLTDTLKIPIRPVIDCPEMEVNIGFPFLRRCFENTGKISWCNVGTAPSPDTKILVVLPPELDFTSAGWPVSQVVGDSLWFDLGNVEPNECGSFNIVAVVDCDSTELGQGLCIEARIFPDSFCMPLPEWSGADIRLNAECQGDSLVLFHLRNVGDAPTSPGLEYIVIEDQVVLMTVPFNLPPLEEITVEQPVQTGILYRLEADQEPFHPGQSMPSRWVEGCGMPENQGLSLQYSVDDRDLFIDIDCHRVVASWDPNDKTGLPEGYSNDHFIEPNTDITYRIRFQNTGTDTAFTVVIRDTLDPWLDPASLRLETASHAYTWNIVDGNTLKCTFNDILLPDSTTNEPASHGFVNFRISQRAGIPLGTVIHNSAAIYFDFNPPVITNQTFHTVGQNYMQVVSQEPEPGQPGFTAGPNPFLETTTFRFEQALNARFSLFDQQGRLLRQETIRGDTFQFRRDGLPQGIYLFDIRDNDKRIASGQIIAQ